MSAWTELKASFETFEQIQDRIVQNNSATDDKWRQNLVNLRRELQGSIVRMREVVRACEAEGSNADACRQFANALSTARSVIALHQAEWPAVAIDTNDASYAASLRDLRTAIGNFRKVARGHIEELRV